MKQLIATVFFPIIFSGIFCMPAHCQTSETLPDQVKSSRITLKPSGSEGKVFRLSDPPSKLEAVFGTPVSTSNALSEIDNTTINRYDFKGIEIYFEGNSMFSLKIKSDAVSLNLDGKPIIKTGDHISKLGTLFPNSYALKKDGQMTVGLQTDNGAATDASIGFWYDKDGIITAIVI